MIANHAGGSHFPGGGLGVDVFFVLSGFLITRLLVEERARTGRVSSTQFYARRALRLLPALILVVVFVGVAPRLVPELHQFANTRDLLGTLFFVQNWVYAAQPYAPSLLPHAWSLAVEEQFYLVWPVILLVVFSRGVSARSMVRWLCATVIVTAVLMAVRVAVGASTVTLSASPEGRGAVALLTGAALAFWFDYADLSASRLARIARTLWPAAALLMVALIVTVPRYSLFYYFGGWLLVAASVALLLVAALSHAPILSDVLSFRPLRWVGTISYSLYLWHVPVILIASTVLKPRGIDSAVVAAVAVPLAFLLAAGSYYLIERPISGAGRAWLRRASSEAVATTVHPYPAQRPLG